MFAFIREPFVVKDGLKANLIISTKNLIQLENERRKILEDPIVAIKNSVSSSMRSYFSAKLESGGQVVPVKVRLKGKGLDHYQEGRYSLHFKVDEGYLFHGMTEFSLNDPVRRAIFLYWFNNEALEREDVMHPRFPPIELSYNGASRGVYLTEEVASESLMANNNRKPSIILGYSDYDVAENRSGGSGKALNNLFLSADFAFESPKDFLKRPEIFSHVERATNILRLFQEGKLKTSQVFKVEKVAKWLALTDIMNAWHSRSWGNIKLYYDPVLSKFEPVNWDAYNLNSAIQGLEYEKRSVALDDWMNNDPGTVQYKLLFADMNFMKAYMQALDRVTRKEYLDQLIVDRKKKIDEYIAMMRLDYPYHDFAGEIAFVYWNQKRIREKYLNIKDALTLVSSDLEAKILTLKLINPKLVPIEIVSLSVNSKYDVVPKKEHSILFGDPRDAKIVSQAIRFDLPAKIDMSMFADKRLVLTVHYKILGTDELVDQVFEPYSEKVMKTL